MRLGRDEKDYYRLGGAGVSPRPGGEQATDSGQEAEL
jgi:hypothetical protein